VIGIRAYQWGWEYFYPKGIDLNYNVNPSYSTMVGNSLKYTTTNSNTLKSSTLWKYYQNKNNNKTTSTPAHMVLSPSDTDKVLNFMKFSDLGVDNLKDASTFKKIQSFSKSNPQNLYSNLDEFNLKYKKISDLYLNDHEVLKTNNYSIKRQHNYASQKSLLNNTTTFLDTKGVDTMLHYNYGLSPQINKDPSINNLKFHNRKPSLEASLSTPSLNTKLNQLSSTKSNLSLTSYLSFLEKNSLISSENDSAQLHNPLKYSLNNKWNKKLFLNSKWINTSFSNHEITNPSPMSNFSTKLLNESISPRFKDLKSAGTALLPSERNSRLLNNLNITKSNLNYNTNENVLSTLLNVSKSINASSLSEVLFTSSNNQWSSSNTSSRLISNSTMSPISHTPVPLTNASSYNLSFDKFLKKEDDLTPNLLKSKEESAPNHVFNSYWLTHWSKSNPIHRYENLDQLNSYLDKSYFPTFHEYAEYDFKNW
jgi:hypothetical protein